MSENSKEKDLKIRANQIDSKLIGVVLVKALM